MSAPITDPWLQPLRSADQPSAVAPEHRDRLVCWPPAGGSATFFHPFAAALPETDVRAVQPPGRANRRRTPPVTDPEEAVEGVLAALDKLPPTDGRLIVMGHSMGAAMAHLLATRAPATPDLVVLSAWPVPGQFVRHPLGKPTAELGTDDLFAFLRSLDTPGMAELDDSLVAEYLLPPLRSDLLLGDGIAAMTDHAWTKSPVLLIAADDDQVFSPAEVAAWRDVVDVRAQVRLTGGHFALSAHVETVADAIRRAL